MPFTIPGSTIRTTGTCGGTADRSRWSTPAPDENRTFRLGSDASNPGGGCQAIKYSTAARSPVSGHTWNSISGACSENILAQLRPRATSDLYRTLILLQEPV